MGGNIDMVLQSIMRDSKGKFIRSGKVVKCSYCGKEIYRPLNILKKNNRHFCSRECYDDFKEKCKDAISEEEIRDIRGKFIKGFHYSIETEFKKGLTPWNRLNPNLRPSPTLSYILSVLMGDGCIYQDKIILGVTDRTFADSFAKALREIKLNPWLRLVNRSKYGRNRKSIWRVETRSKTFSNWFRNLELNTFLMIAKQYPVEFIRGFYESEGCICTNKKRGYIAPCIINTKIDILEIIRELVTMLGFKSKIREYKINSSFSSGKYFRLDITGTQKERRNFITLINPCVKR